MSMKVGYMRVAAVAGMEAQQQASPNNKKTTASQQTTQQQASPAYAIDLSTHARLEKMDGRERLQWLLSNFKQFDGEITVESRDEFLKQWHAAQDITREKMQKENTAVFVAPAPHSLEEYLTGDEILGMDLYTERRVQKRLDFFTPLYTEADTKFEKYRNVATKIQRGGETEFRKYNLMFAAMAAISNKEYADAELNKRISRGHTTREEYIRATSYASELQNRAGVFVTADLDSPGVAHANGIRYEYNGSLANIGVKQLDFMARHREADDIWVKVAQGTYQNRGEILSALKDAGFDDTANAYREFMRDQVGTDSLARVMELPFSHGTGALWWYALNERGKDDTYTPLQRSMRGDDGTSIQYTSREINAALAEGVDEVNFIKTLASQREPAYLYQLPNGRWARAKTTQELAGKNVQGDEETESRKKNNPLDAELRNLRNQLETVKKSYMPPDQKEELITSIKKRINTILIQMVAAQKGANKKNSYEQI